MGPTVVPRSLTKYIHVGDCNVNVRANGARYLAHARKLFAGATANVFKVRACAEGHFALISACANVVRYSCRIDPFKCTRFGNLPSVTDWAHWNTLGPLNYEKVLRNLTPYALILCIGANGLADEAKAARFQGHTKIS